ncbi:MAG: carbohydrate ABC transporter permease [Caldilineaceae bacterium]|nr:carbohydrate ABC transporter permease [Caldilineaceae bacterium]
MKTARTTRITVYGLLLIWCLVSAFPLFWMVSASLKPPSESFAGINAFIPQDPTFANYARVAQLVPMARNFVNSVIVAGVGMAVTVFLCSLAGYAFAKFDFPGKNALFLLLLATMMVPPEAGVVPLFAIMRALGWINNLLALIVPNAATAIGIFYMRQYISSFPSEIMEQARIDGAGDFRIYWQIVLPVITPALAAWASLAFIARWNDFFWPLLFLRSKEMYTLMVSISVLPVSEGLSTPWPVIMAGTTIAVAPLVVIYLVLQSFQREGLALGAVKG